MTPWYEQLLLSLIGMPIPVIPCVSRQRRNLWQRLRDSFNKRKSKVFRIIFKPQRGQYRVSIGGRDLIRIGIIG
jgi:hypothetical protein